MVLVHLKSENLRKANQLMIKKYNCVYKLVYDRLELNKIYIDVKLKYLLIYFVNFPKTIELLDQVL